MAEDTDLSRLEERLAALAGEVAWPATPRLWPRVRPRLRRASRWGPIVLLVTASIALAGGTQTVVAGYRAFHGATIERVERLPSPLPPPPGDAGTRYGLGQRSATIADAARAAGFTPLQPAALGAPDAVCSGGQPAVVALVYRPRAGLPPVEGDPNVGAVVMETRASVDGDSFGKLAGPGTTVQEVTVNGGTGFWITGAPHGFVIYRPDGADRFRVSGDVLIWNQDGLVVRVESHLDRAAALRAAGTARAAAV